MADTSARILRLLSLLQARIDWPAPALAERLGVSARTQPVSRDDLTRLVVRNPDRGDTPGRWQCVGTATLHLPAEVVARWAPGGSVVTPIDSDRSRLTIGGWSWVGIAGLFITFDADLDDVTPPALADAFATVRRRLGRDHLATR
ncbi:hypothetical protein [Dactylosporangium matsuzakiense]|uniref:WYL domain-containing protein n=1 Tax=Dactylosporangium matsuzakiense TaxID=53360 RepID=A0A9W6NSB6_9ACTN|nr:hypothetical protein Dmats_26700 [Dactylosporangium matsuzakiense]GLL08185.1 hypothetical protein GCM10017581_099460 [Dactylosporangium matsuzakiense]